MAVDSVRAEAELLGLKSGSRWRTGLPESHLLQAPTSRPVLCLPSALPSLPGLGVPALGLASPLATVLTGFTGLPSSRERASWRKGAGSSSWLFCCLLSRTRQKGARRGGLWLRAGGGAQIQRHRPGSRRLFSRGERCPWEILSSFSRPSAQPWSSPVPESPQGSCTPEASTTLHTLNAFLLKTHG